MRKDVDKVYGKCLGKIMLVSEGFSYGMKKTQQYMFDSKHECLN